MKFYDDFEVITGSILIMSHLPTISHAYKLLMQEENHKKLYQASHVVDDAMVLAVNQRFGQECANKNSPNRVS